MSEMNNATNSEARLESILDQVRVLKTKYDERAEVTGENFNVFSILDRERDEEKTHSAIIAELLNPHGSHSQGTLFLKLFLKRLKPTIDFSNKHTGFKVRTEVFVFVPDKEEKGFLDIVIENDGAYIVIENKIGAGDYERQLEKYCNHIMDEKRNKEIKMLCYLTLKGNEPQNYSHSQPKIDFEQLSYCKDIVEWLDNCIKEVARIPQIRETLYQYQMLLKKLTGQQPINRRYAMKNILLEDKNYNLIPDLEVALSDAQATLQTDLQCKFLSKLESQLKDKEQEKLNVVNNNLRCEVYKEGLVIERKIDLTSQCLKEDELKAGIKECSNRSDIGLTFSFFVYENCEIVFRIACNPGWLYYGFVLFENEKRVKIDAAKHGKDPYLEYLEQYRKDNRWKEDFDNGWLAYKDLKYPKLNFKSTKKDDEEHNLELVKELVAKIAKTCDDVKKNLLTKKRGGLTPEKSDSGQDSS